MAISPALEIFSFEVVLTDSSLGTIRNKGRRKAYPYILEYFGNRTNTWVRSYGNLLPAT